MGNDMMWSTTQEALSGQEGLKVRLFAEERPLSFQNVLTAWQTDAAFRTFFLTQLTSVAPTAFFWEMPPITRATLERPYEFVVVNSPYLARVTANRRPFVAQLQTTTAAVISFPNLGGDAVLIVPRPLEATVDYAHLGAFLRNAPRSQQMLLLQKLGEVALVMVGKRPLWISTSGLGVYWLHIRLDSRPKYYTYAPYKEEVIR